MIKLSLLHHLFRTLSQTNTRHSAQHRSVAGLADAARLAHRYVIHQSSPMAPSLDRLSLALAACTLARPIGSLVIQLQMVPLPHLVSHYNCRQLPPQSQSSHNNMTVTKQSPRSCCAIEDDESGYRNGDDIVTFIPMAVGDVPNAPSLSHKPGRNTRQWSVWPSSSHSNASTAKRLPPLSPDAAFPRGRPSKPPAVPTPTYHFPNHTQRHHSTHAHSRSYSSYKSNHEQHIKASKRLSYRPIIADGNFDGRNWPLFKSQQQEQEQEQQQQQQQHQNDGRWTITPQEADELSRSFSERYGGQVSADVAAHVAFNRKPVLLGSADAARASHQLRRSTPHHSSADCSVLADVKMNATLWDKMKAQDSMIDQVASLRI